MRAGIALIWLSIIVFVLSPALAFLPEFMSFIREMIAWGVIILFTVYGFYLGKNMLKHQVYINKLQLIIIGVISSLVFFLPYIFWSYEIIDKYRIASVLAIIGYLAVLFVSFKVYNFSDAKSDI